LKDKTSNENEHNLLKKIKETKEPKEIIGKIICIGGLYKSGDAGQPTDAAQPTPEDPISDDDLYDDDVPPACSGSSGPPS
tara:strand:- start:2425 stop:2664 length:240 start_codon:yes stop_codon:yes gene_type:complete